MTTNWGRYTIQYTLLGSLLQLPRHDLRSLMKGFSLSEMVTFKVPQPRLPEFHRFKDTVRCGGSLNTVVNNRN